MASPLGQQNGLTPFVLVSASGVNPTQVQPGPTQLFNATICNTQTLARFVSFYDTAVAPTSGFPGNSPVFKIMSPASSTITVPILGMQNEVGAQFQAGLSFAIVANQALADQSGVNAGDCIVNLFYR